MPIWLLPPAWGLAALTFTEATPLDMAVCGLAALALAALGLVTRKAAGSVWPALLTQGATVAHLPLAPFPVLAVCLCISAALAVRGRRHVFLPLLAGPAALGAGAALPMPAHLPPPFSLYQDPVFSLSMLGALMALTAYFRLRRRGLMKPEQAAPVLAGILAAGIAGAALGTAFPNSLPPAQALSGPALALTWMMTRPLFPARTHAKGWGVAAAAMGLAQIAAYAN